MGFAHHGVPEQKANRSADHQHHKRTKCFGFVLVFEVQVKRGGHPTKQHEHFVQITHRNVTDICAYQITFIPAYQRANECHADSHPGDFGAQRFKCMTLVFTEHAQPVKTSGHEKQHAHPQNRRLTGQKVFEPEHLIGPGQAAGAIYLIRRNTKQRKTHDKHHQHTQRPPEPGKRNRSRHGGDQNAFLVHVHKTVVARKGKQAAGNNQRSKNPVKHIAPCKVAFVQG